MARGMERPQQPDPHPRSDQSHGSQRVPERLRSEPPIPGPDPFDDVADEIDFCLHQVQGLLGDVTSGAFDLDPDAGMGGIDRATRHLKQLLSLPEWPTEPAECDPAALVRAAIQDLLAQRERPLVLRVAVDNDLPRLAMRPRDVTEGLEELLEMATTHCGQDGELTVRAERAGYGVNVTVLAVPAPAKRPLPLRTWQLDDRLERMIDQGHGSCGSSLLEDGTLRLELQLDTVVRN